MILNKFLCTFLLIIACTSSFGQIDSSDVNDSPYGVVYNHLFYLQKNSYEPEKAARSFRSDLGEELAIQLKQILDGKGMFVDINLIPDENNYLDSSSGDPVYHLIENEPRIYVRKTGGKWYYSRTTVESIPALFEETFPFGTNLSTYFESEFWQSNLLGMALWKWLGIIIMAALFFLVFFLLNTIIKPVIRWIVKTRLGQNILNDDPARKIARLISLIIATKIVLYFLPVFQFPVKLNSALIRGLEILAVFFMIFIVIDILIIVFNQLKKAAEKTENSLDDQLLPVLLPIFKFLIYSLGAILILSKLDVNVAALLAGISIGGLAVALAAQDTVKNFFGSIMIFLDKPFQIGDLIEFESVLGTVEEVGVRSTRIRTPQNSLTYVPNGKLADAIVNNLGLRQFRRFRTDIGVTYDTPPEIINLFVEGIRSLIELHSGTRNDNYQVHLNEFGPSSLNIMLLVYFDTTEWSKELKGRHELISAIIDLAHDLGIRFAFPTQTLFIEEVPGKESLSPKPKEKSSALEAREVSLKKAEDYFKRETGDEEV